MWKDFFYFSKGQRIGISFLILLILVGIVANILLSVFFPPTTHIDHGFLSQVEAFQKTLLKRDSFLYAERKRLYEEKYRNYAEANFKTGPHREERYTLFPFDPNTTDSAGFVRLGLKPFIASNILKYRNKGGFFKTSDDFAKVYGISTEKMKELEPFISINERITVKDDAAIAKPAMNEPDLIVDLNSADTSLLMQVKGIGRGYALGIVRFRKTHGGFVSVDQLSEIYGMRPENLDKIRRFCSVNTSLVQKIKVNTATADKLNFHPYINFYQAKAIYELRRHKGRLKDIAELKNLPEFNEENLSRIQPYLSFE